MLKQGNPNYLSGLNGIRAIAAVGVMLSHVLLSLNRFHGHVKHDGLDLAGQGVVMFFTLSGFLITHLLFKEMESFGRIDAKKFYMRRILRIWPVYFLYLMLAVTYHWIVGQGKPNNLEYLTLFIFFLPNIAFNLNRYPADTAPLWSIGIEEQFYLVWPWVVGRIKQLKTTIFVLVVAMLSARILVRILLPGERGIWRSIFDSLGYDYMGIGALFAICYKNHRESVIRICNSLLPEIIFTGIVILHAMNQLRFLSILGTTLTSIATGFMILTQITKQCRFIQLENPLLNHIGSISYGIYVYHMLVISIVAKTFNSIFTESIPIAVILPTVCLATYGIALLSYRFLETPFLKLKDKFSQLEAFPTKVRNSASNS